jgi:hypothetical protein
MGPSEKKKSEKMQEAQVADGSMYESREDGMMDQKRWRQTGTGADVRMRRSCRCRHFAGRSKM